MFVNTTASAYTKPLRPADFLYVCNMVAVVFTNFSELLLSYSLVSNLSDNSSTFFIGAIFLLEQSLSFFRRLRYSHFFF